MSNLGLYQKMTTWAKKVGGPVQLFGIVAVGGYCVLRTVEAGGKTIVKTVKKHMDSSVKNSTDIFTIHSDGITNDGIRFEVRDKFRVLEIADEGALIEKINDENNPYFVSISFLKSISDYES